MSRHPAPTGTQVLTALLLGLLLAAAGGCGYLRSAVTGSLIEDVSAAALEHDDVDLVSQALPTYLLLMDGLVRDRGDDAELLRAAAEGYTAYAALIETDQPARAGRLFARAREYGRRALAARRDGVAELLEAPFTEFQRLDERLRDDDLPYVFWAASAWGAWISAHTDSMTALADLPKVMHLMGWVLERDPAYRGGSPHVFLGVYHATLPPMLGGDPAKARRHFERALEITAGADLMVRVQMARHYARQIYDRELFVELLEEVLARPVDDVPELTLQNAAAKQLARDLLEDVDVYF